MRSLTLVVPPRTRLAYYGAAIIAAALAYFVIRDTSLCAVWAPAAACAIREPPRRHDVYDIWRDIWALPEERTSYELDRLARGLGEYRLTHGRLPATLDALCVWNSTWCVGERAETFAIDGWGTPLRYVVRRGVPDLHSAGPDRRFGTSDDRWH